MTKKIILFFILLSFFMTGCEDTADKNVPPVTQPVSTLSESATKEIKKQPIAIKKFKKVVKRKFPQAKQDADLDKTGLADEPQILDLSLPTEYHQAIPPKEAVSDEQENYLPDLFADKKSPTNNAIQVDGSLISREEAEVEKKKSVDGVGIGIKITP